jgi:hypothetical protein
MKPSVQFMLFALVCGNRADLSQLRESFEVSIFYAIAAIVLTVIAIIQSFREP